MKPNAKEEAVTLGVPDLSQGPDVSPISAAMRMQLPHQRTLNNEEAATPMSLTHFFNSPLRSRNQLRLESQAGSSMVSPLVSKRPRISAADDFKDASY